jgi:uncharacterized protein
VADAKEQMAGRYATELAARVHCHHVRLRRLGQGGGALRQVELPSRKIADIAAAAEFAFSLSFVRVGRVGYLGVCATAQYALAAVAHGVPIGSFASVAGWFHDLASVASFYGGAEGVELWLRRAQEATGSYLRDGAIITVPAYDPGNQRAAMTLEMDYYGSPLGVPCPSGATRWRK